MSILSTAHKKSEWFICTVLEHRLRNRFHNYLAAHIGTPLAGTLLAYLGGFFGLVIDMSVMSIGVLAPSATIVGIPISFLLLYALYTSEC